MKRVRFLLVLLAVLSIGLLSACADPDDPVTEACAALQQVNTAMSATAIVGPASDINDIIAVQNQLSNSWRALVSAVEQLPAEQIPPSLIKANQEFQAVPVATQSTPVLVALTTVSLQANIAAGVVSEFSPACMTRTSP